MPRTLGTESFLGVLWRRKWIIVATVVFFVVAAAVIAKTVSKVYESSAQLLIVQNTQNQGFDAVQAAQVSARTYGNLFTSPNVAALASRQLGGTPTRDALVAKVAAAPVPETQLLKVTLQDTDPQEAKRLADVYTRAFVAYVRTRLSPSTRVSVSLADPPSVPDSPIKPRPSLYVLIAALVGLGLGTALAFLRDRLDSRLRTSEDFAADFGLPVLARLPRRGRGDLDQQAFSEAFRLMRTNLQFIEVDRPLRTIAFTSFDSGEGKSTVVSQLALAIASSGGDALVVEADVRRPSQQAHFLPDEAAPLQPGFTTFIVGTVELDDVVHTTRYPSVNLIPAGPQVPSLSGLMQSERGRQIVDRVADLGQLALFDLPPLSAGADAATIAARTDAVVLVIDLEQATRGNVREALRQLEGVRANVIGFVLNRDRAIRTVAYGYGPEPDASESGPSGSRRRARR